MRSSHRVLVIAEIQDLVALGRRRTEDRLEDELGLAGQGAAAVQPTNAPLPGTEPVRGLPGCRLRLVAGARIA